MANLTNRTPSDKSQPARLRALAVLAITQSLSEMAVACPADTLNDAAYMLMREAAMRMIGIVGKQRAAETLYRLADELATYV
jgi:hypothetical protein